MHHVSFLSALVATLICIGTFWLLVHESVTTERVDPLVALFQPASNAAHSILEKKKENFSKFLRAGKRIGHAVGFPERDSSQKVVLIVGPHKTGTSLVQRDLSRWTKSSVIPGWTWPSIEEDGWQVGNDYWRLVADLYFGKFARRDKYAKMFRKEWLLGRSIVFGSDAFDNVLWGNSAAGNIIDGVLNMMPWGGNNVVHGSDADMTVVVSYRSPRVEHLVSVWRQMGKYGESLSQFILSLADIDRQWHCTLNPLGVANAFIERGLRTVVIDLSGVRREQLDLSNVVACEVMNSTSCKPDQTVSVASKPIARYVDDGTGSMDLDIRRLELIDRILARLDASYCHIFKNENFSILHGSDLLSLCKNRGDPIGAPPIDAKEAATLIQRIVKHSEY